ncbi:MAG: hypothetical protein ACR2Q4_17625 [Geminicoccaceae bacterium]
MNQNNGADGHWQPVELLDQRRFRKVPSSGRQRFSTPVRSYPGGQLTSDRPENVLDDVHHAN